MVRRSVLAGCRRGVFFAGCLAATWLLCSACGGSDSIGFLNWTDNGGSDTLRRTASPGGTVTAQFVATMTGRRTMGLTADVAVGSGLTASLSPDSVSVSETPVTATVGVPGDATEGTHAIQLFGTIYPDFGPAIQTNAIVLEVTVEEPAQLAAFNLDVQPSEYTWEGPNTIQAFEYQVTPLNGFTGTVAITVAAPGALWINRDPDPASLEIGPTDAAGGVFELYWDGNPAAAEQTVTVTAASGDQSVEQEVAITIPQG